IHIELAIQTGIAIDYIRSVQHSEAAVRFAEEAGNDRLVASTTADLCYRLVLLGHPYPEDRMALALDIDQRLHSFPPYQNPSYQLGIMLAHTDSPDRARPLLRAELERLERAGNAGWQIGVLLRIVDLELRVGNWREAAELAQRALSIGQNVGIPQERGLA